MRNKKVAIYEVQALRLMEKDINDEEDSHEIINNLSEDERIVFRNIYKQLTFPARYGNDGDAQYLEQRLKELTELTYK